MVVQAISMLSHSHISINMVFIAQRDIIINSEVKLMKAAMLYNQMALDIVTGAQGMSWAIIRVLWICTQHPE